MGYQFTNNWPYNYTAFPTMIDHTDPVNNTYFTGLHTEIENIEDELGLDPAGDYATVKDAIAAAGIQTDWDILQIKTANVTGDIDTSSLSFVDMAGASVSITTGANYILILAHVNGRLWKSGANTKIEGQVRLSEAANILSGGTLKKQAAVSGDYLAAGVTLNYFGSITAGAKTIKLMWRVLEANTMFSCNVNSHVYGFSSRVTVIEFRKNS